MISLADRWMRPEPSRGQSFTSQNMSGRLVIAEFT